MMNLETARTLRALIFCALLFIIQHGVQRRRAIIRVAMRGIPPLVKLPQSHGVDRLDLNLLFDVSIH